jgi:hypothetical protein
MICLATWDSPPRRGSPDYAAFEKAFENYVDARSVVVPKYTKGEIEEMEKRRGAGTWRPSILGIPDIETFDIGQGNARLMDFQVICSSHGSFEVLTLARSSESTGSVETGITVNNASLLMKWAWFVDIISSM